MSQWQPAVEFPRALEAERRGDAWALEVDGREVRLSNLTKIYWPADGYTKGDLLTAYLNLAPLLLPHLRDRPLTLLRMPDGINGPSFYEKQAPSHTPDWVPRARITGHGRRGVIDYLVASDTASLLFIANLGCIEIHPAHARAAAYDRPDYAFFDLDPFDAPYAAVRQTALLVRVALERLGLRGYPRTSGATGMQVHVPLDGSHTFAEARAFVERVCRLIHRAWPDGTTLEPQVARRTGKVYLDYAMVGETRNIASVYSVRARPGAPLATPLRWEEVEQEIEPGDFTIATIWERLARDGDLHAPLLAGGSPEGQNLRAALEDLGVEAAPAEAERAEAAPPAGDRHGIDEYARKRRFDATPEPPPAPAPAPLPDDPEKEGAGGLRFMVHQHHARRRHFDLRLERDGVLVSWAVPKGLPPDPGVRRLAVHVEDHPLTYGTFEGTIPAGEYGAGEVRIFDEGTYEPLEWTPEKVTVSLRGRRLHGEYHLVRTGGNQWLALRPSRAGPLPLPPAAPSGLRPMLAGAAAEPFDGDEWAFEVKWDGWRALALIERERARLVSRAGRDLSATFSELEALGAHLVGYTGAVDGEIVCLDSDGRPSFDRLQERTGMAPRRGRDALPVVFMAFDLLWLDGEDLTGVPLEERRRLLERFLIPGPAARISEQIPAQGRAFFAAARDRGLEGIIAKRLGSPYQPGRRTRDWLKIKAVHRQDCVIVGWTPGRGGRAGAMGALVVAAWSDGRLQYAGHVGTGFRERDLERLRDRLGALPIPEPPVELPPPDEADLRDAHWVRPELVCAVEHRGITTAGRLRHASFKGLRDDIAPEDCLLEGPAAGRPDGDAG